MLFLLTNKITLMHYQNLHYLQVLIIKSKYLEFLNLNLLNPIPALHYRAFPS